jgi:hypothetical protein
MVMAALAAFRQDKRRPGGQARLAVMTICLKKHS